MKTNFQSSRFDYQELQSTNGKCVYSFIKLANTATPRLWRNQIRNRYYFTNWQLQEINLKSQIETRVFSYSLFRMCHTHPRVRRLERIAQIEKKRPVIFCSCSELEYEKNELASSSSIIALVAIHLHTKYCEQSQIYVWFISLFLQYVCGESRPSFRFRTERVWDTTTSDPFHGHLIAFIRAIKVARWKGSCIRNNNHLLLVLCIIEILFFATLCQPQFLCAAFWFWGCEYVTRLYALGSRFHSKRWKKPDGHKLCRQRLRDSDKKIASSRQGRRI